MRVTRIAFLAGLAHAIALPRRSKSDAAVLLGQRAVSDLPSYAIEYAPLVYFHSEEVAWLSDLFTHLSHVSEVLDSNYQPVAGAPTPSLESLNDSKISNKSVYLTAPDDVNKLPAWLLSEYGKPLNGRSSTSTIIIGVDHDDGRFDAFYFLFASFNLGPYVALADTNFGNHVGDWEHTMVRFKDGQPTDVWLSAHATGNAYTYQALAKSGKRPVVYTAIGSHAFYPTQGQHSIVLDVVNDYTDNGTLWDPVANYQAFYYVNTSTPVFTAAPSTTLPTNWLYSFVEWGDQHFKDSDPRQREVLGQRKWSDGPTGPIDKTLNRSWAGVGPDPSFTSATTLPPYIPGKPIKVVGS